MKKIQTITLKSYELSQTVELPRTSEILSVSLDNYDQPVLHYMFDMSFEKQIVKHEILMVKGDSVLDGNLSSMNHLATLEDALGHIFYVFEKVQNDLYGVLY